MNRCISFFSFLPQHIQRLEFLLPRIQSSPLQNPHLFCQESKSVSKWLGQDVRRAIAEGSSKGCMVVSNLPVKESEMNPEVNLSLKWYTVQALLTYALPKIEMVSYEAEGAGRLFQHLYPKRSMAQAQTSLSSTELEIHTEQAFSRVRPDILSLGCIRGDPQAMTYILTVETLLEKMTSSEIQMLYRPLWYFGVDLSFRMHQTKFIDGETRGPFPILAGKPNAPRLRFDQDLIRGTTSESNALIEKILDIYYRHRLEYNLKPGEILFINNHKVVHGRSSFSPRYDGKDRFLTRCFGMDESKYKKYEYTRIPDTRTVSAPYS